MFSSSNQFSKLNEQYPPINISIQKETSIFRTAEPFYVRDPSKVPDLNKQERKHVCSSKNTTAGNHGLYQSDRLNSVDLMQRSNA